MKLQYINRNNVCDFRWYDELLSVCSMERNGKLEPDNVSTFLA